MTARTVVLGPGRTRYVCVSCYRGEHGCEETAGQVRCDCGCALTPWPFECADEAAPPSTTPALATSAT